MNKRIVTLFVSMAMALGCAAQLLPYQNPKLSAEERAADLCSRLTLKEKADIMRNGSPAIPRLGIPQFEWWSEALHGVARNGFATVFPNTTGMASSFDDALLQRIYTAVSDEARAKNNLARDPVRSRSIRDCPFGPPTSTSSVTPGGAEDRKPMARTPI